MAMLLYAAAAVGILWAVYRVLSFVMADADTATLSAAARCPADAFEGKVVWITGASSGIGKGLAHAFSQRGAKIILSARREAVLEAVKRELADAGQGVHAVLPLDLEDLESLPDKCAKAVAAFGRVDILVNNGGISTRALARDSSLDVDQRLMNINYMAQVAIAKGVLPGMIARKSGHIVNIASLAGKIGSNLRSAYCGSKFALLGFFDALRMEELDNNIHVTNICPGSVQTDVAKNALGANGEPIGASDGNIEAGVLVERAASLIVAAAWAQLDESWIAKHPELFFVYLMQYFPVIGRQIQRKKAKQLQEETLASIERNKKKQ